MQGNAETLHMSPADYEAWYHTPRGSWIGQTEFRLLQRLIKPKAGETILDVGCGTGHFSRRFAQVGMHVTGIDPDTAMLGFAQSKNTAITYLPGSVIKLPFENSRFDHTVAITSLCFVKQPVMAIQEMWRVGKKSLTLGLLNRHSLLYRQKYNRGAYRGARWDTLGEVKDWIATLEIAPRERRVRSCIYMPGYHRYQRLIENLIPSILPFGAFLIVNMTKP